VRERRIEWTPFAEDEIILVGPPSGPWAAPRALTPEALARMPLVLREQGSGTRESVEAGPGVEQGEGAARVEVGSSEAARRCALEGVGYTFISLTAVKDDLDAGRLRRVKYPGTPVRRTLYVGRLRTVTPTAASRDLLALVSGSAGAGGRAD
jgi:DNA-binding transcriptional LysR family regulator